MEASTLIEKAHGLKPPASWRSILYNCGLIVAGSLIYVTGMNAVLIPQELLSGGVVGIAIIIHYLAPAVSVGLVYFLLNLPLMLVGWFQISRRFMYYTILGMVTFSLAASWVRVPAVHIEDPILGALLAGIICGVGGGIILRSLGSAGGLDILAIYFNKRFGLRVGMIITAANVAVLLAGAYFFNLEKVLYSIIYVYSSSRIIDNVLSGFNRRKVLIAISSRPRDIADHILHRLHRGVTFLKGEGAFSGAEKDVIFTVTTLTELPKVKDIIFGIDPEAFVVVNDTLEVLGKRHGKRRIY